MPTIATKLPFKAPTKAPLEIAMIIESGQEISKFTQAIAAITAQIHSIAPIDRSISLQIMTAVDPIANAPIIANCIDKLPKLVNVKNLGAKNLEDLKQLENKQIEIPAKLLLVVGKDKPVIRI